MKGKYTLLEFWASWCGPCRSFNPELMEQYELYKEEGFEILSVSLDTDKEKWEKAIQKDGLTWPNVSDLRGENNEAAMIYGVRDIPDNFLIDENGIIIARFIRGESLKNKLKELFDNNMPM
ncbi:MAG TPA: TlpA disulfide reductase family protein [Flavobacterium sp.]|nr:TlpA disulfide reductase family protein [Flavobacterium sp.]